MLVEVGLFGFGFALGCSKEVERPGSEDFKEQMYLLVSSSVTSILTNFRFSCTLQPL